MYEPIIFSDAPQQEASAVIVETLERHLGENKSVLWLISGGSNIELQTSIMSTLLVVSSSRLRNLTIIPMDERYGRHGHPDSNVQALRDAGFKPGEAHLIDVLEKDMPFEETTLAYDKTLKQALDAADVVIGQFGIGSDGHTAGIKPDSPAVDPSMRTVVGYKWDDHTRMTMTRSALTKVTEAYVLAYGENKKNALQTLRARGSTVQKLPSILFYTFPKVTVFSDQF